MRLATLLFAAVLATAVSANDAPTLGGSPGMDLSCEPMPGAAAGHFVCEDPASYARCKALEGKGSVRLDGADKKTPVLQCQQGG